nr:MAG TPA: hypothetical protein [Caudoviricetes sp.]
MILKYLYSNPYHYFTIYNTLCKSVKILNN